MNYREARSRCDKDMFNITGDGSFFRGFLKLPQPENYAENKIYSNLITANAWLDIVEIQPNSWIYQDRSPVKWFNWNSRDFFWKSLLAKNTIAQNVEINWKTGKWSTINGENNEKLVLCTYFLPTEAKKKCHWLSEFQTGQTCFIINFEFFYTIFCYFFAKP